METFSTSSPESLHVKSPGLPEMFFIGSSRSVVTFESYSKSSMASAWQTFFSLCKTTTSYEVIILARNVHLGFLKKCCYFWNDLKSKMPILASDGQTFFFLKNLHAKSPISRNVPVGIP